MNTRNLNCLAGTVSIAILAVTVSACGPHDATAKVAPTATKTMGKDESREYPKPGRIIFAVAKWNKRTHRFGWVQGKDCGKGTATFRPGQPLAWVARLPRHASGVVNLQISRVGSSSPLLTRRITAAHVGAVHGVAPLHLLDSHGITAGSGMRSTYVLVYRDVRRILAQDLFIIAKKPTPTISFGY